MAKYIIASTRLNDDGSVHSVSHPIEVDSDTINAIKIFGKTYIQQKHGRWIEVQRINPTDRMAICECSNCGDTIWVYDGQRTWNYCPNCGARMDGGENGRCD